MRAENLRVNDKNYYYRNKEKIRLKKNLQQKQRLSKKQQWLVEYKNDKSCIICGESFNNCLEFHHIDPTTKYKAISSLESIKLIQEEIKKCIIVCANCHRKIHGNVLNLKIENECI